MELRREDSKSYGSISPEEAEVVVRKTGSVRRQHRAVLIFSGVVLGLVLLSIVIAVVYKQTRTTSPAPLLYQEYQAAAVASDGAPCAKVCQSVSQSVSQSSD